MIKVTGVILDNNFIEEVLNNLSLKSHDIINLKRIITSNNAETNITFIYEMLNKYTTSLENISSINNANEKIVSTMINEFNIQLNDIFVIDIYSLMYNTQANYTEKYSVFKISFYDIISNSIMEFFNDTGSNEVYTIIEEYIKVFEHLYNTILDNIYYKLYNLQEINENTFLSLKLVNNKTLIILLAQ